MLTITQKEYDALEQELEGYHNRMSEIESDLDKIDAGAYDEDPGEIEAIKEQLDDEYVDLESKSFVTAKTINDALVSDKGEDDPSMDYQLTEMKSL